jgi:hypothetical protein
MSFHFQCMSFPRPVKILFDEYFFNLKLYHVVLKVEHSVLIARDPFYYSVLFSNVN